MRSFYTRTRLVGSLVMLSLCLAMNPLSLFARQSARVGGTVKAKDGKPIANARIFCRGGEEADTDAEGAIQYLTKMAG